MSDQQKAVFRLVVWTIAILLMAATRIPGPGIDTTVIVVLGTVVAVALAFLATFWPRATGKIRGGLFLVSLTILIIPPSQQSFASWVPGWLVGLFYVIALHLFFQDASQKAPVIDATGARSGRQWLRFAPMGAAIAIILGLPFLRPLLPLRIRAALELQTAFEPLVPLMIMVLVILPVAFLRIAMDAQTEPDPDDHQSTSRESSMKAKEAEAA